MKGNDMKRWGFPNRAMCDSKIGSIPVPISTCQSDGSKPQFIELVDNRIYFYADIFGDKTLQLNRSLRDISNRLIAEKQQREQDYISPIYLNIFSDGGDVFAGLSCMDEILSCSAPVYTVVDGCCASAATFLSIVGKKRYIKKHSMMLIHQLSSGMWGKYDELQDSMKNFDMYMDIVKKIYSQYTNVPASALDEILKHDLFWTAEQCLEYGLADQII